VILQVIMEIVAVTSAVYGLVLSMVICVIAVAIFSGHLLLLLITVGTMLGMIKQLRINALYMKTHTE